MQREEPVPDQSNEAARDDLPEDVGDHRQEALPEQHLPADLERLREAFAVQNIGDDDEPEDEVNQHQRAVPHQPLNAEHEHHHEAVAERERRAPRAAAEPQPPPVVRRPRYIEEEDNPILEAMATIPENLKEMAAFEYVRGESGSGRTTLSIYQRFHFDYCRPIITCKLIELTDLQKLFIFYYKQNPVPEEFRQRIRDTYYLDVASPISDEDYEGAFEIYTDPSNESVIVERNKRRLPTMQAIRNWPIQRIEPPIYEDRTHSQALFLFLRSICNSLTVEEKETTYAHQIQNVLRQVSGESRNYLKHGKAVEMLLEIDRMLQSKDNWDFEKPEKE